MGLVILMQKVIKNSNIEVLRILSMVMIIAHHLSYYSGIEFLDSTVSINKLFLEFILLGGKIGSNIFFLSG